MNAQKTQVTKMKKTQNSHVSLVWHPLWAWSLQPLAVIFIELFVQHLRLLREGQLEGHGTEQGRGRNLVPGQRKWPGHRASK